MYYMLQEKKKGNPKYLKTLLNYKAYFEENFKVCSFLLRFHTHISVFRPQSYILPFHNILTKIFADNQEPHIQNDGHRSRIGSMHKCIPIYLFA